MNDLLTVKDVAKILGLSTNTVYKYVNSGLIRSSRAQLQQGRFRVPKQAVEEFLGSPLDELHLTAPPVSPQDKETLDAVKPIKDNTASTQPKEQTKNYDDILKSLIEDNKHADTAGEEHKSSVVPEEAHSLHTQPKTADETPSTEPNHQHIDSAPPTFTVKAARILLLLCVSLFVINLAYFSPPHPVELFTQMSILFLFILLTYQYGGMRKRVA